LVAVGPFVFKGDSNLVPAQHFSAAPHGTGINPVGRLCYLRAIRNVYYSGDTGYVLISVRSHAAFHRSGWHSFHRSIPAAAARESTRGIAPLSIWTAEAVKAQLDLGTPLSVAAHFQVFRLGAEGFNDAMDILVASLKNIVSNLTLSSRRCLGKRLRCLHAGCIAVAAG